MADLDGIWRKRAAARCGGEKFDAPGSGYAFSAVLAEERALAKKNTAGKPETALLALSVADPTWKMPAGAMEAALAFYNASDDATRYTDNSGIRGAGYGETHAELADYLKKRYPGGAGNVAAEWVQYSPGSVKRALAEYIPTALFGENTRIVFPTPGYPVVKSDMNRRGAEAADVPLVETPSGWRVPLEKAPTGGGKTTCLYFNFPHNPTGSTYTRGELEEVLAWARANDVVLIANEAYNDLRYDDSPSLLDLPGWEEAAVVLGSVSKGWSATGLRFGWMVGHPTLVRLLAKVTDVKDSGLFGPSIAAGLTCLRNPAWADATRERYRKLHQILNEGLRAAGFEAGMPSAGLCQFTRAPRKADGAAFASIIEMAQWFREKLRISLMHYEVQGRWFLRWAVTLKPIPQCGLETEEKVLAEVARRLKGVSFEF